MHQGQLQIESALGSIGGTAGSPCTAVVTAPLIDAVRSLQALSSHAGCRALIAFSLTLGACLLVISSLLASKAWLFRRWGYDERQRKVFCELHGTGSGKRMSLAGEDRAFLHFLCDRIWFPNVLSTTVITSTFLATAVVFLPSVSLYSTTVCKALDRGFVLAIPPAVLTLVTGILIFAIGLQQTDLEFLGLSRAKVVLRYTHVFPLAWFCLLSFFPSAMAGKDATTVRALSQTMVLPLFGLAFFSLWRVCRLFSSPLAMRAAAQRLLLSYEAQQYHRHLLRVSRMRDFEAEAKAANDASFEVRVSQYGFAFHSKAQKTLPVFTDAAGVVTDFSTRHLRTAIRALKGALVGSVGPASGKDSSDSSNPGDGVPLITVAFDQCLGTAKEDDLWHGRAKWAEVRLPNGLPVQVLGRAETAVKVFGARLDRSVFSVRDALLEGEEAENIALAIHRIQSLFSDACSRGNPQDAELILDSVHEFYKQLLKLRHMAGEYLEGVESPQAVAWLNDALREFIEPGLLSNRIAIQHKAMSLPYRYANLWLPLGEVGAFGKQLQLLLFVFYEVLNGRGIENREELVGAFLRHLHSFGLYGLPISLRASADEASVLEAYGHLLAVYNQLLKYSLDAMDDSRPFVAASLSKLVERLAHKDRLWDPRADEVEDREGIVEKIRDERHCVLFGFSCYLLKRCLDLGDEKAESVLQKEFFPVFKEFSLKKLAVLLQAASSDRRDSRYDWFHWDMPSDGEAHFVDTSWPSKLFAVAALVRLEERPSDRSKLPVSQGLAFEFREEGAVRKVLAAYREQTGGPLVELLCSTPSPEHIQVIEGLLDNVVQSQEEKEDAELIKADLSEERMKTFQDEFLTEYRGWTDGLLGVLRRCGAIATTESEPPEPSRLFGFSQVEMRDPYVEPSDRTVDGIGKWYGENFARSQSVQLLSDYSAKAQTVQTEGGSCDAVEAAIRTLVEGGSRVPDLVIVAGDVPWESLDEDNRFIGKYDSDWIVEDDYDLCEWQFRYEKYPRIPVVAMYQSSSPGFLVCDRAKVPHVTIWTLPRHVAKGGGVHGHAADGFSFIFTDLKHAYLREPLLKKLPEWLEEVPEKDREHHLALRVWLQVHQVFSLDETEHECFGVWIPATGESIAEAEEAVGETGE